MYQTFDKVKHFSSKIDKFVRIVKGGWRRAAAPAAAAIPTRDSGVSIAADRYGSTMG